MTETAPLDDKAALITGASSGIGEATARKLASDGANVALAARREDRLRDIAEKIEADAEVESLVVTTDVTDEAQVDGAVEQTVEQFGQLDVVVANAGVGRPGDVETMSTEDYRAMTAVNVDGMFFTARAALPHLRETAGVLVLLGSYSGTMPYPMNPVYAATKWWTRGFALSLAGAIGDDDVAVTTINPAETRTEFRFDPDDPNTERFEPGQATEPAEVAAAVAFAARQEPPTAVTELDLFVRDKFTDR